MKIISAFFSLMLVMTPAWAGSCNDDDATSSKDGMNANSSQEKNETIEDNDT